MGSYQQQPHPYMRHPPPPPMPMPPAPPPPMADLRAPYTQGPTPVPPPGSWYSGPFQFHPAHSSSHPPPPPPPPGHQWGSSPHSDNLPPPPPPPQPPHYAAPHPPNPPPYPSHLVQPSQFPPLPQVPRPPLPPHAHPNPQHYPQPQFLQEWGNANWGHQPHHSSWNYQADRNEEDWASRAREWAASRAAMENQHQQSQFGTVGHLEEQSQYPSQYPLAAESQHQDIQQPSGSISGYQNYPVQDSYLSYTTQDGTLPTDAGPSFPQQQQLMSSSVHLQEVPSSYSSVPGKEGDAQGQNHFQLPLPAVGSSLHTEPAQFAHVSQSVDRVIDPRDRPLEFTPRFSFDNNPKMPSLYEESTAGRGKDSFGALPSLHPWTSSGGPGVSFPSFSPTFPPAAQMFGPSQSFPTDIPSIVAAVGPPGQMVPGDGIAIGAERPKKAAVPNWLREEIIKKKATFAGPVQNHNQEQSRSIEDEAIDKSVREGDQGDSKSIDSSKSTEREDDDEDYVNTARTAAINQEIKRILTEVLLKVTDELFDEIATKVLSEVAIPVDGAAANHDTAAPNHKLSPYPTLPAPKVAAKVLIPVNTGEYEAEDASEKTGSGAVGNVLGLADYASEEEEEETQSSNQPVSNDSTLHITSINEEITQNVNDSVAHKHPHVGSEEPKWRDPGSITGDDNHTSATWVIKDHNILAGNFGYNGLLDNPSNRDTHPLPSFDIAYMTKKDDVSIDGGLEGSDASYEKSGRERLTGSKSEFPSQNVDVRKSTIADTRERDTRRHDIYENKSSFARESSKDKGSSNVRDEKVEDSRGGHDRRQQNKDKVDDKHGSKERSKVESGRGERIKDVVSREQSPRHDEGGGRKERERDKKVHDKYDVVQKREQKKDEMAGRVRHKAGTEASKHKRRRSPPVGSRMRNGKENSVVSYSSDSSDEATDESRRKLYSKRNHLSPSPSRSRKRQVSKSPKRPDRRHSPHSSLDTSRGRRSRSRSRSPVRRHRR